MKNILTTIALTLVSLLAVAQERTEWSPVPAWPFVYDKFQTAKILTNDNKAIKIESNIHIGRHSLWYNGRGGKLEAKRGTIKAVTFPDGTRYTSAAGKICRIVLEDTINGTTQRLLCSVEVDMRKYNEEVRNQMAAESSSTLDIAGLNDMNLEMSIRESANIYEQQPLPIINVFYIQMDKDVFMATEGNILKHLPTKEERRVYRAYTRKAEIQTSNLQSMMDVYTTFFRKK